MNRKSTSAIAASGTVAGAPSGLSRDASQAKPLIDYGGGPSPSFVARGRNPELAANPPTRFEPTVKAPGDVVL